MQGVAVNTDVIKDGFLEDMYKRLKENLLHQALKLGKVSYVYTHIGNWLKEDWGDRAYVIKLDGWHSQNFLISGYEMVCRYSRWTLGSMSNSVLYLPHIYTQSKKKKKSKSRRKWDSTK